ncbi:MAG: AcrR family transcriptional regulator [Paracoccaceae bacterium]|jgi:AcrR family transcriptional regulator
MTKSAQPSRRDLNLADIRARATLAAERTIIEHGFETLSARGLARDLSVSVGSLYNAVGDLDGVVRAVNAKCARMLSDRLRAAVNAAPADKLSRVVAMGEVYFDFALAEPRRWWLLFERRSDALPDAKTQELQSAFLEMLIRAGDGDPSSDQHRQFFLLLWASVHGLASLACRPTIVAIDPEVARSYVRDLVVAGFRDFPAA